MGISVVAVVTILSFMLRYSEPSQPTDQFEYVADVGKRTALTCRTSIDKPVDFSFRNHQNADVKEIVNGGQIINGLRVRYAIEHSGQNEYQLVILRATLNDTGIYRCTEDSGNGEIHEVHLRVTESVSETKPFTETLVADVGSSVSLPCRSHRTEGVDWSFMSASTGNLLHICQNGRFVDGLDAKYGMSTDVLGDYNLVIPAVSSSDAGAYTCTEDAGAGQRHIVKLIVVNTADRKSSQDAATGSTVAFVCRLNNPRELIRWSLYKTDSKERTVVFNGRNVVGNYSERMSVHNNVSRSATSVLLINTVEDGDGGKYVCHTHTSTSINHIFELSVRDINESLSSPETRRLMWIVPVCIIMFSFIGLVFGIFTSKWIVAKFRRWCPCCKKANNNAVSLLHQERQNHLSTEITTTATATTTTPTPTSTTTCCIDEHALESLSNTSGSSSDMRWREVKMFKNFVCKDRVLSTSDPFIWELTQVRHLFEECVNKAVAHIDALDTKPDAIVGLHGCDSAGSVLAAVIAERLKVPLILMRKRCIKHHVDVAKNDTPFHSRYNQEMSMGVELRAELADKIHKVVIVDTEIVTGRSLEAAIKELEAHHLHAIECMVLSDVPPPESRPDIATNIFSVM